MASIDAQAPQALGDDAACINAVEQGLTLRQKGQLREALKVLTTCSEPACPAELRTECTQRIDAIGLAMPTLVLAAKDGAGNDLFDVKVTMDGALLVDSLDGRPVSVDPGEHDFRFETPGQPPVERKLVLREGEKNRSEVVVLGPPAPPAASVVAPQLQPAPQPAPTASSWSPQKTLAVVSGAVGLAGLGLGIAWSAYAVSAQNQEKSNCGSATCVNHPQAQEDYTVAQRNATGATVGISAGAALVATAGVLWFTAFTTPTRKTAPAVGVAGVQIEPTILRSGGGLAFRGNL